MTLSEYQQARDVLGWPHERVASVLGVSKRATYRHLAGGVIPESVAHMLRLLVIMRLTMSDKRFEEITDLLPR